MTGATRLLIVGLAAGLTGCRSGSTAPPVTDLRQAQTAWTAHHLTRYAYRYMTTGFLNNLDGQAIRLVVLADTVRSAQFVATGDSVPVVPSTLPTIDGLFARALAARGDGTLAEAQFDSIFSYPARLVFSGPPDASGAILASNLELLP